LKTMIMTFISFLLISMNSAFATPINDLETGDTVVGVIGGTNNSMYYLETKSTDNLTIGIQSLNLRGNDIATDYYAQIRMDDALRVIVGNRILDSRSKAYLGGAVESELTSDIDGYASLIAGSGLQELQLGAKYKLTDTSDINLNFSTISGNKSSIGLGLSCKF
jgi:hypothetical protein